MNNISFDNPWLLFIALPIFAALLIPFCITVRKDNVNAHNITAVVMHILIGICLTLAISGMTYERVITETNVYVLADISYSAEHNIDDVQKSVEDVAGKLPRNSKVSVICFGRNYQLISDMGDRIPNIKSATEVDKSATDIGSALRYAGNLFKDDVIKRIIIITDGVETVASNNLVKVVNSLQNNGIYVDAVYLDDNISDDTKEVQIDSVQTAQSTYVGKDEEIEVLIRANCGNNEDNSLNRTNATVTLYQNDEAVGNPTGVILYNGLNAVTLRAPTDEAGTFKYEVRIQTEHPEEDTSPYNNVFLFTQEVSADKKVLFLGGSSEDLMVGNVIYGRDGVDYISDVSKIPFSIEQLYMYDEIVLCNFDVRTIPASSMFVASLSTLVNDYGKSLITYGNTFIQAKEEDQVEGDSVVAGSSPLNVLSDLLPVKIGNEEQDARLFTIILDVSSSMRNTLGNFEIAKTVAKSYVDALSSQDYVMVISFSDSIEEVIAPPVRLVSKQIVKNAIDACEGKGDVTTIGGALSATYERLSDSRYKRFYDKRVLLISDGLSYSGSDSSDAIAQARAMSRDGISVSAVGTHAETLGGGSLLNSIVNNGEYAQGTYYPISNDKETDFIVDEIKSEIQDVKIEGDNYSLKLRAGDDVLQGVDSIGAIRGFWFNSAKRDKVTTVITATYYKDKVTTVDVPIYAYWNKGKGKVTSFLSDIAPSSGWTESWTNGWINGWESGYDEGGTRFLANIPNATLPDERIASPFIVEVEGSAVSTRINVSAPSSLNSAAFSVTLTDPNGIVTTKTLAYDSSSYFATFSTDAPGTYTIYVNYNDKQYEATTVYSVSYYAEYDSFSTYSKSRLYRLISQNGSILDLEETNKIENSDSAYTSYIFSFTLPLMIVAAILFIVEIILRQLKWKDVTSFFKNLFRRRS